MTTREIPPQAFDAYAEDLRRTFDSSPRFELPLSDDTSAYFQPYALGGVVQGARLTTGHETVIEQSGEVPIAEFVSQARNWGVPSLPRRIVAGPAQTATIDDAVRLLAGTEGEVAFFTGAGISKAGPYPVDDHWSLEQRLGFVDRDFLRLAPHGRAVNDQFVRNFRFSKEYRQQVLDGYATFIDSMFRNASTPAHVALSGIIRHFGMRPTLLTANYDCKHEATPSNLLSVRATKGWHDVEYGGRSGELVRSTITELGQAACKLLVVCGVFNDTRGVFNRLKQTCPDLKILAINQTPPEALTYAGRDDYALSADLHVAFPAIARQLTGVEPTD